MQFFFLFKAWTVEASETNYVSEASSRPSHHNQLINMHFLLQQRSSTDSCCLLIFLEDTNCAIKEQIRSILAKCIWEFPCTSLWVCMCSIWTWMFFKTYMWQKEHYCIVLYYCTYIYLDQWAITPSTTTSNNQIAINHHDICIKIDHAAQPIY